MTLLPVKTLHFFIFKMGAQCPCCKVAVAGPDKRFFPLPRLATGSFHVVYLPQRD